MSPEEFAAYCPMTDELQSEYEKEGAFRDWCKENDEDPMEDNSREIFNDIDAETGDNFWKGLSDEEREGHQDDMLRD